MGAKIIDFPVGRTKSEPGTPTCFRCVHYAEQETRCQIFDEQIDSELYAARDCGGYETGEEPLE